MPQYHYTIIDNAGQRITKTTLAGSKDEVVAALTKDGFFIVEVRDARSKGFKLPTRLNSADKIFFTQNLAVLLSSGISLGEALDIIARDTPNKPIGALFSAIQNDLEQGNSLSKALARYPNIFDSIYVSLIQAGENSGELATVMDSLAAGIEKDVRTANQVRSALLYPAFVLSSLFVLGMLLTFFVLPKITKVFEQLNIKNLPFTTRFLLAVSNLVAKYPIPLFAGIVIVIVGSVIFFRTRWGKSLLGKLSVRLPFIKQIIMNLDLSRLSLTLSLLLNAGVPIQQAIEVASGTVKTPKLGREFKRASERLASGVTLSAALQDTSLPHTFIALVAMGERSGNIASVFKKLADHYEELLDNAVKNFTGILEPVLTLVVGLLVGAVVLTVIVPIYQFIGNLEAIQ